MRKYEGEARRTLGEAARKFCVELVVLALKTSLGTAVALTTAFLGIPLAVGAVQAAPTWVVPDSVVERLDAIVGTMAILHDAASKYLASP